MPKRTRPHVLEELSIQHVKGILPAEWIRATVHVDYGVDMQVELVAGDEVTGLGFSIQLKGTDQLQISGDYILHRCKVSTAKYFLRRPEPVMYVVYDAQGRHAYWLWVKPYLEGLNESRPGWREQETIGIRIPRLNVLSLASVEEIARYVQTWWAEVVPKIGAVGASLPAAGDIPQPGALPPGSRLPFTRNALFTGRKAPLKTLARALLHDQHPSALVTQAVAGMGGVGKTQLAVEFAYRYGRFLHGVHWLNAGSPAGLAAELAACGAAMALAPWPDKQPDQVARTLDAWRRSGPRLVVLDNLEDIDPAREWLVRLSGGPVRVLVTARRQDWPRDLGLRPMRLDVFTPPESRAFLREYLPQHRAPDPDLDRLADRLGHLPLALELAGRYLDGYPTLSIADYLAEFQDALSHVSMREWDEDAGSPTDHDLDVAATFELSWKRVSDEVACRVFLLAGHCAPNQPIPDDVLQQAAGMDKKAYGGAVHVLMSMGLLKRSDSGPMIHPLLADFARALPDAGEGLRAVAGGLASLAVAANATGLPSDFLPLRPHVEVVAAAAEKAGLEKAGTLWNELGVYLGRVADYDGARGCYERALGIDERVYGEDHASVALRLNNLGQVLQAQGDLAGARGCFERALGIFERVYGLEHPNTAIALNDLGSLLYSQGNYAEARRYLERALGVYKRVSGEQHPWVATAHNNLGNVLQEQGDLAGARGCFERALAIDERVYGLEHPKVAIDVNNLGGVLWAEWDLAGARGCFERALGIWRAVYGEEHPRVATVHNNLGNVLQAQWDLAGARGCFERALAIDERVYGLEHPEVAVDANNLGNALQDLGDLAGARGCYERALGILEKFLPEGHPSIEMVRQNLESLRK